MPGIQVQQVVHGFEVASIICSTCPLCSQIEEFPILLDRMEHACKASTSEVPSELNVYSMEDVSHRSDGSTCWIVINDRVYDLTKFLHEVNITCSYSRNSDEYCTVFICHDSNDQISVSLTL